MAAATKSGISPAELLKRNRERARKLSDQVGTKQTRSLLGRAEADLVKRLREAEGLKKGEQEPFTIAQMRSTLAQVRDVLKDVQRGMRGQIVSAGTEAARNEAGETLDYLERAERSFRGINQPLGLDHARIMNRAVAGTESSILARIESDPKHPGHRGVLDRYGDNVIQKFEEEMQLRLVAKKPWAEVRTEIVKSSSFLQGAPAYWAERIVRTETLNANNRAGYEAIKGADEELGDMVKILVATFDHRTAADSYAVHGQIRRPTEAFDTWFGAMQHPPARPNDRETVVPHRIAWPIPKPLAWKSDGDVAARWSYEGRKGSPPARPNMTTVPLEQFGKRQEPKPAPEPAVPTPEEQAQQEQQPEQQALQEPAIVQRDTKPQNTQEQVPDAVPVDTTPRGRRSAADYRREGLTRLDQATTFEEYEHGGRTRRVPRLSIPSERVVTGMRVEDVDRLLEQVEQLGDIEPEQRPPTRRIRADQILFGPSVVSPAVVRHAIETNDQEPPVLVRHGRQLVALDSRSAELVQARILEGRASINANIVDDKSKKEKAPVDVPKPSGEKPKPIQLKMVGPEEFLKDADEKRGIYTSPETLKAMKKAFKGDTPDIESFEKVWGSEASGHGIRLSSITSGDLYDGGGTAVRMSGKITRKPGTYEYTDIKEGKPVTRKMVVEEEEDIGDVVRTFRRHANGRLEVHHDYFWINERRHQGGGSGEAMLRQSIQTYEKLGVDDITIDTAEVGRYTWASFGYDWVSDSQRETMAGRLERFLIRDAKIPPERAIPIAKRASRHSFDTATLDVDGIELMASSDGEKYTPMRVGKAFMFSLGGWSGKLDLKDKESPSYQRAKKRLKL